MTLFLIDILQMSFQELNLVKEKKEKNFLSIKNSFLKNHKYLLFQVRSI